MTKSESIPKSEPRNEDVFGRPAFGLPSDVEFQTSDSPSALPTVSRICLHWFTWYSRRYIRRHFHSLRVSLSGLPPETSGLPLVIYSNHASWWDALACLVLKDEFFPDRTAFAPIDAAMLARYKFFRRLGFFGVERGIQAASTPGPVDGAAVSGQPISTRTVKQAEARAPLRTRGAIQFLRATEAVLQSPQNLLAITPQGRFADVRERPIRFEAGLGHLAARVPRALFVPLAAEYVFWEERLPEILVRFGEPVEIRPQQHAAFDAKYWTRLFEQKLTGTQDALAAEAQGRNPADFQIVLRGGAGQGGVYDWWRSFKAKLRGEKFRKEHGTK